MRWNSWKWDGLIYFIFWFWDGLICVVVWCGAEGFGKAQPISYQAQGPRRERRNVQGWVRKAQAAERRRWGPSCPRPTKVTEEESSTPSKTTIPVVPNKRTNTVRQLWGRGGGVILGEAVTFAWNARNWQFGCINEEMTSE